jgi:hypothetical protein
MSDERCRGGCAGETPAHADDTAEATPRRALNGSLGLDARTALPPWQPLPAVHILRGDREFTWHGPGYTKVQPAAFGAPYGVCSPVATCVGPWTWCDPGSGGNTHSALIHPTCPDVVFIGSDVGGLKRGSRIGALGGQAQWFFEDFSAGLHRADILDIAIGPTDPDNQMYVLTASSLAGNSTQDGQRALYRYDPISSRWRVLDIDRFREPGKRQPLFTLPPAVLAVVPLPKPVGGVNHIVLMAGSNRGAMQYGAGAESLSGRDGLTRVETNSLGTDSLGAEVWPAPVLRVLVPGSVGQQPLAIVGQAIYRLQASTSPQAPARAAFPSGIGSLWVDPVVAMRGRHFTVCAYMNLTVRPSNTDFSSQLIRATIELSTLEASPWVAVSDITFDVVAHLDLNNFSWPPANTVGPPLTSATQRQLAADFRGLAKAEFGQVTGVRAPGAKAPTLFAAIADLAFTGGAPPDKAAQFNYWRVLRLQPSGATWDHAWETFANVLPIPNSQRGCQDSVDLGAPDVTDQPEHWRLSRFFWMRSTATGQVFAAHGRRGRKGGAQLGVWGRSLAFKNPDWRPLARYLPLATPLQRRLNAYGCEIPAAVFIGALAQFYETVLSAGAVDSTQSQSEQAAKLLSLLRSERWGPKLLVAYGWREEVAMGGVLAPSTADIFLRFDLWAKGSTQRGSVCHAQSIGNSSTALPPADAVSFVVGSAFGTALSSIALGYMSEFGGERQAEGGLRWTVLAIPALAFWYENVVLPLLGGTATLASFAQPSALAALLTGGEKTVWVAQNFSFFARTGKVSLACRAWMPPGGEVWLGLDTTPAPWTWGPATPGYVPSWTTLPAGSCPDTTTTLPAGVVVDGLATPELRVDADLDAFSACTGPQSVLPANMNRFRSWHHRRGAAMFAESIAVWPQASYPPPTVSTPPRILWGNGAESFASLDNGASFTPLGTRLAPGQPSLNDTTALAEADTARWVTQGLGLMLGYDVAHVPPDPTTGAAPEPEAVLICVDDGGIFRAANTNETLEWTDRTWNIPRSRTTPLPDGLGPPSFLDSQITTSYRVTWRRLLSGAIEVLAAVGSFRVADARGRVLVSHDRGTTFTDRILMGLPEGVIPALTSVVDSGPAAQSLAAHATLAAVVGHGVYWLAPGEYRWEKTGDFFAHAPSASMVEYSPAKELGDEPYVSLRKRVAYACFYDTPRDHIPDVKAFFTDDVAFDIDLGFALTEGVKQKPLAPAAFLPNYTGGEAVAQRKRDVIRLAHAAIDALYRALMLCFKATTLRGPSGAYHAFATLSVPGVDAIQDNAGPGNFTPPLPLPPPELAALGVAMVDPTQIEAGETIASRGARIAERLWRTACAVASEYAGVFRLEDTSGGLVDVQGAPSKATLWRQIAGLARANAWTLNEAIEDDKLSIAQMLAAGFPQSWRSVTSLAPSPDGQIAVTCDTVRLNARAFEALDGLAGTKPTDPNRNLVFEGGVFLLSKLTAKIPGPNAPAGKMLQCQLLFTHPAPAAAAFSGTGAADKKLFVALNVYDILERSLGGPTAEAMIPAVGPFTSAFPVVRVANADDDVQYAAGATVANPKYFDLTTSAIPGMRWPVGLFRVSLDESQTTPNYLFSPASPITTDALARAAKESFASTHKPVPSVGAPCLDNPTNTGKLQLATATLESMTWNQCCSIIHYRFLRAWGEWLYCGRRGASIVRAKIAALESKPALRQPG